MTTHRPGRRRPTTPRRERHLHAVGEPTGAAEEFLGRVARALADPQPLTFLHLAAALVATLDPRTAEPHDEDEPDAAAFVETLVGHPTPETTALLQAFTALLPDNYLAQRARAEVRRRAHRLPDWLQRLEQSEPGPSLATVDVLGDGENVVVSQTLPDGSPLTAVVYVDHNLGTVVKDAFVLPETAEGYRDHMGRLGGDEGGTEVLDLDPAEAHARIRQAIDIAGATAHRLRTDSWPACRPLVEWMVGRLPAGGVGFAQPEWTESQRYRLVADFMRSPEAAGLTEYEDGKIALDLMRFTTDHSGGDPLRWSFVNVEILLGDWFLRTVTASDAYLLRMPTVLRALVRWSHRRKDVPAALTARTLQAVTDWEPVFVQAVSGGGPFDLPAFQRRGDLHGDELMGQWGLDAGELAARAVGGEAALAALDTASLPDEEFRWDGIAEDIRERVAEILTLCDRCAEELFDVEVRTACRRVLARAALTQPAVFRRRSKASTAAAAVAWSVASANGRLNPYSGGLTSKALLAHFGVTGSVSERARPFLRAFGADEWQQAGALTFGTAEVLTAGRREELVRARDEAR